MKSLADVSLKEGLIIGILFGGAGTYIELISFGVLSDEGMNAPPVIGSLAGAVFLLPGVLSLYYAVRNRVKPRDHEPGTESFDIAGWLVSCLILTALTAIGLWISLAGGGASFSGGVTGSITEFRIAFGVGAVLCAAASALFWSHGLRKLWKKKSGSGEE